MKDQFEITFGGYNCRWVITPETQTQSYVISFWIPAATHFLMDRICIFGLASDMIDGTIWISDPSIGRLYIDSPLILWAVRSKQRISVPIMFPAVHVIRIELRFNNPVSSGFDLLGNPRKYRNIDIMIMGKNAHYIGEMVVGSAK